ncbi:MAG: PEP-CTERM sorting domain-containing protein [bacterium]
MQFDSHSLAGEHAMIGRLLWAGLVAMVIAAFPAASLAVPVINLDADTPATGSNLDTTPLVTPYGTITFEGEIRDRDGDPEFNAAGASGDVFNGIGSPAIATLSFDFDVDSITFIYGGNLGAFDAVAYNASGGVVDTFYQASTDSGEPAGPITMTGPGIRSLTWEDAPGWTFCAIDNVSVVPVPEPCTITLLSAGALGLLARRRRLR